MNRLILILISSVISIGCMAFQGQWKPGEGQVSLNSKSQLRFDAGNFEVDVEMDVIMKYRFSTLLADHVELFIPKYNVQEVKVFKKGSNDVIFTASIRPAWDEQRIEKIKGGDSPHFQLSPDLMSAFQMMSLDFRLQRSSEYLLDRHFSGYLRGAGFWGWDVPASKRWKDVFSFYKVEAAKAKEEWLEMTKESEPIIYGDLLDATFSVYGLMGAISKQLPDAFKSSKEVSPAFSQMASLKGQLKQAKERGDEDVKRREALTNRAWNLLKNDMTAAERAAVEKITSNSFNQNEFNKINSLFEKLTDDFAKDEKLSKENSAELKNALNQYTPSNIQRLNLPSKLILSLKQFESYLGPSIKPMFDPVSKLYGYQARSGNWIIKPEFIQVKPVTGEFMLTLFQTKTFMEGQPFVSGDEYYKTSNYLQVYSLDEELIIAEKIDHQVYFERSQVVDGKYGCLFTQFEEKVAYDLSKREGDDGFRMVNKARINSICGDY